MQLPSLHVADTIKAVYVLCRREGGTWHGAHDACVEECSLERSISLSVLHAHLKESIVAKKKGRPVDAEIENTVMARGNVQAHGRCDELHSLTALNLQHSAHCSHHDLHC